MGVSMGAIRDFIDFMKDTFAITGAVLSSKWIWLMVGCGLYFILQAWLMLAISPLVVLILPVLLIVYLIMSEDKRNAARYSLKKKVIDTTQWNVSSSVDEYIKTITKVQILDETRQKDSE
jgi:ABC-type multidrug transport system fused ATPase/permease subunit